MKAKTTVSFVILLLILTIHSVDSQWQQTALTTGNISSLAATQTHIFASSNSIYSTTNNGASWEYAGLSSFTYDICANTTHLFAATTSQVSYVYRSTNNGLNWSTIGVSAADGLMSAAISGSNVYVGTIHYGIRRSTNNGENWISLPSGLGSVQTIAASGDNVFAGNEDYSLYRSTNNGTNWIQTSITSRVVNAIAVSGSMVYAGTTTFGIYISADNGNTWIQSSLNNQTIKSLAVSGNNVFAGTTISGVYYSSNAGATWEQKNEGLTNLSSDALLINGDHIYLGTGGAGVWKRPLSEVLAIQNISTEIPEKYSLHQNYPNPFNPVTNIKFSIPKTGVVKLTIYDAAGREAAVLFNGELLAGTYNYDFDASQLASGIYFYKLESNDFTQTKKMVLIK